MGDPRSFPADQEAYEQFLADEGVQQLPNPPIDMPDWLADTRNDMSARQIYRFDEIEWHVPIAPGTDPDTAAEAAARAPARRYLAQGDAGFYTQVVKLPPGFDGAGAQPRSRRGVHGARGQLRVRR